MKINIFGVGRSGTKAVQLYLTYVLAKKYGEVRLNYEPYFWLTRSGPVSFEGIIHHTSSPQFSDHASAFSKRHQGYLKNLIKDSDVVVTKFIRGNGRILPINELTKPDYTIVVIRDVYEVLASMLYMEWDFNTVGYSYFPYSASSFWSEIKKYLIDLADDEIATRLQEFENDRIARNAFYWYAMNHAALTKLPKDTLVLPYEKMSMLEHWASEKLGIERMISIRERVLFEGRNIHKQYPLVDKVSTGYSKWSKKKSEWIYYLSKWRGQFLKRFLSELQVGNNISLASEHVYDNFINNNNKKIKLNIPQNSLLDYLQHQIKIKHANLESLSSNDLPPQNRDVVK